MNSEEDARYSIVGLSLIFMIIIFTIGMCLIFCSCTISLQNISTHGTATDLVDEDQKTDADISPNLSLPIKPI